MIVMHAGPHKTATTYIQHNLHKASAVLRAHGWVYPEEGRAGQAGHHDLAHNSGRYIGPNAECADDIRKLPAKTDKANLVFSAEGFCRWSGRKYSAFADLLGADALDVVYVVRHPVDVAYSYWAEEVKQGYSRDLPQAFAENFADPIASRLVNPMIDLHSISQCDKVRLHVIPYEVLRARKIDIYANLMESVLGIQGDTQGSNAPRNASFPIELTEFLRMMTLLHGKGAYRLTDGSSMRLRFTRVASAKVMEELTALVKTEGEAAHRTINFSEQPLFVIRMQKILERSLAGMWTYDFPAEELYGPPKARSLIYYDSNLLLNNTKIREAAEAMLAKIASQK